MTWRRAALALALLAVASPGTAQPLGWSYQQYYRSLPTAWDRLLRVLNMATGATEVAFELPDDVWAGHGALTPDGRYFLLPTTVGIARFLANPPSFDRVIGPAIAVDALAMAPAGSTLHAVGGFGRAVLDWETGAVLNVDCCARPRVWFTPDGAVRVDVEVTEPAGESEVVVRAWSEPGETLLWTRTLAGGFIGPVAVGAAHLAVATTSEIAVYGAADGVEIGRIPVSASGLAWRGDTLLVTRRILQSTDPYRVNRLAAYGVPGLVEQVVVDVPVSVYESDSYPLGVALSVDERIAYWLIFTSSLGISVSGTSYLVVDLEANTVLGGSGFGYQAQGDLALESAPPCFFDLPADVEAPLEGGMVGISVVPTANCRPWTVRDSTSYAYVVNPGPHLGPATIVVNLRANVEAYPVVSMTNIGTRTVRITQPAAAPAPPILRASVTGDHVTLTWEPRVGAGIHWFVVRGAIGGETPADVLGVPPGVREWTSPPLPTGSYVAEVVAENRAGRSAPSAPVRFSIGVTALPGAPVDLSAVIVDDRVALSWAPAPSGPAPSGFVVEAAPAGTSAFVEVTRTSLLSFVATRVPAGEWRARVRAITAGGPGPPSDPVEVTTTPCSVPPLPPRDPWVLWTVGSGPDYRPTLTIRWAPPSEGSVDHYVLELGSATGRTDLGRLVVGGDLVSITRATSDLRAVVRVRARNACGESEPSSEVFALAP